MGGPPATLMSAIWPSGTKPCRVDAPAMPGGGAAIDAAISGPPAIEPLDMEPMGGIGMSDAVGGPLGSRGRDMLPADDPADVPLPIPSMFWARKMGYGQPTAPADAN